MVNFKFKKCLGYIILIFISTNKRNSKHNVVSKDKTVNIN